MIRKNSFHVIIVLYFLIVGSVYSQTTNTPIRTNPISEKFYFGADFGATLALTDYANIKPDFGFRLTTDYFFPSTKRFSFGMRSFFGGGHIAGEDPERAIPNFETRILQVGVGGEMIIRAFSNFYPYLFLGGSVLWFNPMEAGTNNDLPNNRKGLYGKRVLNGNAEIGIRYMLPELFSINFSINFAGNLNDNLDDIVTGGDDYFGSVMLGFSYCIFGNFQAPPEIIDEKKDEPEIIETTDTDFDGLTDADEEELGTNIYHWDTDGDQLSDFDEVNKFFTNPIKIDTDFDGIQDGREVNRGSDPLDPTDGYETFETEVNQATKLEGINFSFNSSSIEPGSEDALMRVYYTLTENPTMQIEIQGHTDNVGDESVNLRLSQERADAVKQFLVQKGIASNRIQTKGLGSSNPIATNDTEAGRAQNRRIEFIRLQ